MSEPLVDALALDSSLRTIPVGFALPLGVAAADPAPLRFLWREERQRAVRAGAAPTTGSSCRSTNACCGRLSCDSVVPTDIAFTSSNPQVARFVAVRRGRTSEDQVRPEIVLDAEGRVVDDPRGVFCPLAPGTTDVTVTTAGRRVSSTIEVVPTVDAAAPARGARHPDRARARAASPTSR